MSDLDKILTRMDAQDRTIEVLTRRLECVDNTNKKVVELLIKDNTRIINELSLLTTKITEINNTNECLSDDVKMLYEHLNHCITICNDQFNYFHRSVNS